MDKQTTNDTYDVAFRMEGTLGSGACKALVFIKMSYAIDATAHQLRPAEAVPLVNDLHDDELLPRMPPHSDYLPYKRYTDIGVVGSAYAPDGSAVTDLPVSIQIGRRLKQLQVFGERLVEFQGTKPRIGSTTPFTEQPLGIQHAYGGADFRVPFAHDDPRAMSITTESDHPGLYPRNPWGTGYLVDQAPIEGMRLPTQEDALDLLSDDRLVTGHAERWFEQPLAAHVGWVPVNCYPRCLFFSIECEPWFAPPDDARLKEVKSGHLPDGYRQHLASHTFGIPPHWRFYQEAVPDLMLSADVHGLPVTLVGLHPEHPQLTFDLPSAPRIQMKIENTLETVEPLLTAVEMMADKHQVTMTYTASMLSPRPFIPGIHKHIPVAVSVNGDRAVRYQTPTTIKNQLAEAHAKANQTEKTS